LSTWVPWTVVMNQHNMLQASLAVQITCLQSMHVISIAVHQLVGGLAQW